ncbi:MAG TPA: RDD family protein [Acidimicrobiales bacterium]|nr:RDD family protein [Acidimicrobiales bacterium]
MWWTHPVQYYDEPLPQTTTPYEYAPWPRRIASSIIDGLVLGVITLPFLSPALSHAFSASDPTKATFTGGEVRTILIVSITAQILYFTGMHAWRGATIGKIATGTMLLRDDGSPVTAAVAFTRAVALLGINFVSGFLLSIPAIVNLLRPIWSPRRQTWHDQIARTVVVRR